ncbi:MAG TPA: hypothetical protein VFR81_08350 [Longimicrobium sp.]|nr:hypothetical protein [Longimicrobium sp.]
MSKPERDQKAPRGERRPTPDEGREPRRPRLILPAADPGRRVKIVIGRREA